MSMDVWLVSKYLNTLQGLIKSVLTTLDWLYKTCPSHTMDR